MTTLDKENLKLSRDEARLVLSALGFVEKGGNYTFWASSGLCHGGKSDKKFTYHYNKGVAQCWTRRCFGKGTDIYGVVEHILNINFYHAKRFVEGIINRDIHDEFEEERDRTYNEFLESQITEATTGIEEVAPKKRWVSQNLWELYTDVYHPYWASRGISQETTEFFGAGYDEEADRITIPIFDINDKLVSIKRRTVDPNFKGDDKYRHDAYDASQVLFNLNNAKNYINSPCSDFNGIILVEGHLDVMNAYELGQPNVVAVGTNLISESHALLLERYTDSVLIIPDEDKHIDKHGKIVWNGGVLIDRCKELMGRTINLYISRLDGAKDIGELHGPDGALMLRHAIMSRCRI